MRRLVALSSTMSSLSPESTCGMGISVFGTCAACTVMENAKVEPCCSTLSTQIDPPMSSTSLLLMARPRPVPQKRRVVDASTWLKDLNSRSIRSAGMPMPVSRTANVSRHCAGSDPSSRGKGSPRTDSTISPCSVNFIALLIRLSRICLSLVGSAAIPAGKGGSNM